MRNHDHGAMKALFLPLLAATALAVTACSSARPEPRPRTINIDTGAFGPNIQISGVDGDDDTPAGVSID